LQYYSEDADLLDTRYLISIETDVAIAGRGAITLSTLEPLPTEPLRIPALCVAGCLPEQNNAVVSLDLTGMAPAPGGGAYAEATAWPEFHNGVAAGLRLAPGRHELTRTWIVYNKPPDPSYMHAGMLMALGVTGHLRSLAATDLYRYLSQEHDATIIGILLGMSVAKRCLLQIHANFCLSFAIHVPAFLLESISIVLQNFHGCDGQQDAFSTHS
jgi:hypothetical protein